MQSLDNINIHKSFIICGKNCKLSVRLIGKEKKIVKEMICLKNCTCISQVRFKRRDKCHRFKKLMNVILHILKMFRCFALQKTG